MIGVASALRERSAVAEFFELFKTPWGFYEDGSEYKILIVTAQAREVRLEADVVVAFGPQPTWVDQHFLIPTNGRRDGDGHELTVGSAALPLNGSVLVLDEEAGVVLARLQDGAPAALRLRHGHTTVIRCGYDLFSEIERLLGEGQELEHAGTPTLDLHIEVLRNWLVAAAGVLVEIPPVRHAHPYAVCLTHDIDFLSLRRHRGDRTLLGFIYRATIGSLRDVATGRGSLRRLLRNWATVIKLPLVYLGRIPDPWQPFASYVRADRARSSFFVIPFRDRGGDGLDPRRAHLRRVGYDVDDIVTTLQKLHADGYEIAVHGIDAWNNVEAGRAELDRVGQVVGERRLGVRMHWLCFDSNAHDVLERAGYDYDATCGFNDTVGFKAGTTQVFRPLSVERLVELPLHIQDTALFYPTRLNLPEQDAWDKIEVMRHIVRRAGGVLTLSWHDRSLAPERLWGRFYERVLDALHADGAWFGTAREVVAWFRLRRSISFRGVDVRESSIVIQLEAADTRAATAGLMLRVYQAGAGEPRILDMPWDGETHVEIPLPEVARSEMTVQ